MKGTFKYRQFGISIFVVLLAFGQLHAQDMSVLALPPEGSLIQKSQLWNLMITNTASSVQSRKISMTMIDKRTNQRVLSAVTNVFLVAPGARLYQVTEMMPVMYNALASEFNGTDFDFLPTGEYQVCYELLGDKGARSGVSCIPVQVQFLSGPQLQVPAKSASVSADSLSFNWTPPTPELLLPDAMYSLTLVRVQKGQDPGTAIKENPVIFSTDQIAALTYDYPATAPPLENHQRYAWQIIAYNRQQQAVSAVWDFETGVPARAPSADGLAYTKLEREGVSSGYSIVSRYLHFSFLNESADSLFQVALTDVTGGKRTALVLDESQVPHFIRGTNHVEIDLSRLSGIRKKHLYELRVTDHQRRTWKMTFQYQ